MIAGGCRNLDDHRRVDELKQYANQLDLCSTDDDDDYVSKEIADVNWMLNISHDKLMQQLSDALIGLHSMSNEHFGIAIVESMAAGNIMVAHNSGLVISLL